MEENLLPQQQVISQPSPVQPQPSIQQVKGLNKAKLLGLIFTVLALVFFILVGIAIALNFSPPSTSPQITTPPVPESRFKITP